MTSCNNRSNTSDLAEINIFQEDYWYLDKFFIEQRTLNLSIGQDELQSPVFIATPERYYKVNFDPNGQKENLFHRNKEIYAYPTPDLEKSLNAARVSKEIKQVNNTSIVKSQTTI